MPARELTPASVGARFVAACALIAATFNPEGYSYYHWVLLDGSKFDPIKGLVGIFLLIGWTVFLRATYRSLGIFGFQLALGFFAMLVWGAVHYGLIAADSPRVITYFGMFALAGVLTVGMVWSIVRRKLVGQVDVADVGGS